MNAQDAGNAAGAGGKGGTKSDEPKSNRSQATKASAQFRAFRRRVTMMLTDSNRWQIELDGGPTELIVRCLREDRWTVSKLSGEIIASNCRSVTEAERVAAHYLCDSFLRSGC